MLDDLYSWKLIRIPIGLLGISFLTFALGISFGLKSSAESSIAILPVAAVGLIPSLGLLGPIKTEKLGWSWFIVSLAIPIGFALLTTLY